MNKRNIVVVGGGTGTHTVLRGLRNFADNIDIVAIVSMSDSGGSTGKLRDEFGQLPVGDVRNALTALAANGDEHDKLLRKLFMYRFDRGEGLCGHNFGNLLLTALTDILGSEVEAIEAVSRILRVSGRVIPVTIDNVNLKAEYEDGSVILGEHDIDTLTTKPSHLRIVKLSLVPEAKINPAAREAILKADLVVLGPGDLYTSVLSNCIVSGFNQVLKESKAKIVYVCNLMSKQGQTVGMNALEHINEVIKYINKKPDVAIVNSTIFSDDLLKNYASEGDYPITNNCSGDVCSIYAEPLISEEVARVQGGDVLKRSLIRHDPDKLASIIMRILKT